MKLASKRDVEKAARNVPVPLMLFDALQLSASTESGSAPQPLPQEPYSKRREALFAAVTEGLHIDVMPAHAGSIGEAMSTSQELGLEDVVAKRTVG